MVLDRSGHAPRRVRVVLGLRYARNFAVHDLVAATEEGGTFIEFPLFSGDDGDLFATHYRWVGAADLPTPRVRQPRNAADYADHLAGRDVGDTLSEANAWFESVRGLALARSTDARGVTGSA